MEIKKGKFIYKNLSVYPDSYMFLSNNDIQKFLRKRLLTTNGESGEQTVAERLIFEELHKTYSEYWFVEYMSGYPNQLTEISPLNITK